MTTSRNAIRVGFVLAVALLSADCRRSEPAAAETAAEAPLPDHVAEDTVYTPQRERVVLSSDRIYFTLTEHEWYARGEPLLHGNAAYMPAGMPISASLDELHRAGEYQGVDFYVRDSEEEAVIYVPVFEGYWQVFRPDTAARRAN
jgi:hypothetical protein